MANSLSGTRIREQRRRFGISQTELARRAGISTSYLNLIEHNKRRIGGALLLSIARELDIPITSLTEGADSDLINTLYEVAAYLPSFHPETADLSAIAERFPGWSSVLAELFQQVRDQENTIAALSDRLTHDPFLAESLHLMLSNITAIRSTAGILKSVEDIEPKQQTQFHAAIHDESKRLSVAAQALIAYFDTSMAADQTPADPDTTRNTEISLEGFAQTAARVAYDPPSLARSFDISLHAVFRQLAALNGRGSSAPEMGVIEINAAGQALHRQALPDFPLPRHGNACPLWPVFRCLSQPNVPSLSLLTLPSGKQFVTFAVALSKNPSSFDSVADYQSSMLIIPMTTVEEFEINADIRTPERPVGTSCRICPRSDCPSRAEPMILEESRSLR